MVNKIFISRRLQIFIFPISQVPRAYDRCEWSRASRVNWSSNGERDEKYVNIFGLCSPSIVVGPVGSAGRGAFMFIHAQFQFLRGETRDQNSLFHRHSRRHGMAPLTKTILIERPCVPAAPQTPTSRVHREICFQIDRDSTANKKSRERLCDKDSATVRRLSSGAHADIDNYTRRAERARGLRVRRCFVARNDRNQDHRNGERA